jgi:glycosyltransferase involved in cell wall biosynthesis
MVLPHAPFLNFDNRIRDFQEHPDVPVVKRTLALKNFFKRIIFVSGSLHSFGMPIMFDNIEYHTLKGQGMLYGFLKAYDVKLLAVFLSSVFRYGHRLKILNFSMASSSVVLCFLSKILGITFTTYFTGVPEQAEICRGKIVLDYKMLIMFSRNVIVNNPVISKRLHTIHKRPYFDLIPNFVEEKFRHKKNSREPFSVLYAGRLEPEKRVDVLLHALAIVVKKIPETKLYITGTGSCYSLLKDLASELALDNAVHFLGWLPRDDIPRWMNRCTVFVQPSLYEGFPNALLEAMASGMAVVAMDVPYARWVVGNAGLLADPKSVDSLATCIYRLLADDKYRMMWVEKARLRASCFTKDTVVKMLVEAIG